jgi:hypothetical protein|tara:strand:+ start:1518 stop:1907 length:390 start_codon:yes stop_codon:yes gene_type:complete
MDKILTEVSAGELLDKISILEIKIEKIKNPELKKQAKKEFETLNSNKEKSIKMTPDIEKLYLKLKETNLKLWKIEDEIRACEKNSDFKENFIKLARSVYFNNDTRSSLKLSINQKLGSNIIEVKEYTKY